MTKINEQKQHMKHKISQLLVLDIRKFLINSFPMLKACLKTVLVASTAQRPCKQQVLINKWQSKDKGYKTFFRH